MNRIVIQRQSLKTIRTATFCRSRPEVISKVCKFRTSQLLEGLDRSNIIEMMDYFALIIALIVYAVSMAEATCGGGDMPLLPLPGSSKQVSITGRGWFT